MAPKSLSTRGWKLNRFLESEAGKAVLILLAGIVFLAAPDTLLQSAAGILLLAMVAAEVVLTVSRLHKSAWNFGQEKLWVYMCIALVAVYSLILVKGQALSLIASVFPGAALLMGPTPVSPGQRSTEVSGASTGAPWQRPCCLRSPAPTSWLPRIKTSSGTRSFSAPFSSATRRCGCSSLPWQGKRGGKPAEALSLLRLLRTVFIPQKTDRTTRLRAVRSVL